MSTRSPSARDALRFFQALNALCLGFTILGTVASKRKKRFDKINLRIKDGTPLSSASSELFLSTSERADIRAKLKAPILPGNKYVKVLLLRINAEMQHSSIPPYFPEDVSIEHVLPQTPALRSRWKRVFPNQRRRKELCLSLGNLTLLTQDANSAIRNGDFTCKKRDIFGIEGNQAFALNQRIACAQDWDEDVILSRQDELLHVTERLLSP